MLEVVEPGLHSTIQDQGRPGWGHLGVRQAGAADPLAMAAANLLAGNPPDTPALEMTLLGGTFRVLADTLVGLAGADMEPQVPEESRRLDTGASHRLRGGTTLRCGAAESGARLYLAVGGGFEVPAVLGSASTDPVAGFGGVEGRALRAGDVLRARAVRGATERRWPSDEPSSGVTPGAETVELTVVDGPHRGIEPDATIAALLGTTWMVSPRADRVGLRLDGASVPGVEDLDLVSLPMVPGAVQVPANGQPIVLMPDAPTVGGYPVPLVVTSADRHRAGQLRPGDELRFRWVALEEAARAQAQRRASLAAVAAALS